MLRFEHINSKLKFMMKKLYRKLYQIVSPNSSILWHRIWLWQFYKAFNIHFAYMCGNWAAFRDSESISIVLNDFSDEYCVKWFWWWVLCEMISVMSIVWNDFSDEYRVKWFQWYVCLDLSTLQNMFIWNQVVCKLELFSFKY